MADSAFKRVAALAELPEGVPVGVTVEGRDVLLVRISGRVYACANRCNHYGAPLSEGRVCRGEVICPWHHARFDVTTGRLTAPPALNDLPIYPVQVEAGEVYIGPLQTSAPRPVGGTDPRTFVILGAGAAGSMAAETLRREGFDGRVILVTAEQDGPYDRPKLSKAFLSGDATREEVMRRRGAFYERLQIELWTGHRATGLDLGARQVIFADGRTLAYDRLLLATGARPRTLEIPGAALPGSFVLRSLADAEALVKHLEEAGQAVVIGASFLGLEVAAALRQRDLRVHVVALDAVPMQRVFGERVGRRLKAWHESHGVRFHLGCTPVEIAGDGRVRAVRLSDGTRLQADVVIAGVGVRPAVEYLEGTGLVEDGAVPVDERLQTRAPGVWAAGDIARVPDRISGQAVRVEHWVVAERQGQHAARSMLGLPTAWAEVPFFWTRQYDESIQYIGFAPRFDQIAYRGDVEDGDFLAGYYFQGRLLAAAGLGMNQEIIVLGQVLQRGIPLSREQFEDPGTDFAGLLTDRAS